MINGKKGGYSLIEVIVAMVCLSLVSLILVSVITSSIKMSSSAQESDQALAAAKAKMNELTAHNAVIPTETSDSVTINGKIFNREWEITDTQRPWLVVVSAWHKNIDRAVSLSGYINPDDTCAAGAVIDYYPIINPLCEGDPSVNASSFAYTIMQDFDNADKNGDGTFGDMSTDNFRLFSVKPHDDDYDDVYELEIEGEDANKVMLVGGKKEGQIRINPNIMPVVEKGNKLEFTLHYVNCEYKGDKKTNVEITFDQGTACTPAVDEWVVTFVCNGGETSSCPSPATVKVTDGSTVGKPSDPTRTDHTFDGWYNGSTLFDFNTPIIASITLVAKWTDNSVPEECVATGTISHNPSGTLATIVGSTATITTFDYSGPEDVSWSSNNTNLPINPSTGTVSLLSGTVAGTYTATITATVTCATGETDILTSTITVTVTNVVSNPCNGVAEYAGNSYPPQVLYNVGDRITYLNRLYKCKVQCYNYSALPTNTTYWEDIGSCSTGPTHTVTFESNGGSAVASKSDVENNTLITEPVDPTKAGYTFEGWYQNSGLTIPWNFTSDKVVSDTTLYAKWSITPTCSETGTWGTTTFGPVTVGSIPSPIGAVVFTPTQSGATVIYDTQNPSGGGIEVNPTTGNVAINSTATAGTYTISVRAIINCNNGALTVNSAWQTVTVEVQAGSCGISGNITPLDFSVIGTNVTSVGNVTLSGVYAENGGSINWSSSNHPGLSRGNLVFTQLNATNGSLTFSTNPGVGTYGITITAKSTCTNGGADTKSWDISVTVDEETHDVYFDCDGGSGCPGTIYSVSSVSTVPATPTVAPSGKKFKHWSLTQNGAAVTFPINNLSGDITLWAVWEDASSGVDCSSPTWTWTVGWSGTTPNIMSGGTIKYNDRLYKVTVDIWGQWVSSTDTPSTVSWGGLQDLGACGGTNPTNCDATGSIGGGTSFNVTRTGTATAVNVGTFTYSETGQTVSSWEVSSGDSKFVVNTSTGLLVVAGDIAAGTYPVTVTANITCTAGGTATKTHVISVVVTASSGGVDCSTLSSFPVSWWMNFTAGTKYKSTDGRAYEVLNNVGLDTYAANGDVSKLANWSTNFKDLGPCQ